MKTVKKKKQKTWVLKNSDLARIKTEVTKDATEKAVLIVLAAAVDCLGLTDEQLCGLMETTDRYACYIDRHLVEMETVRKTIEKGTGIRLKGWTDD